MQNTLTFEKEFDDLYDRFNSTEKGKKLLKIDGISEDKLDVGNMSHAYFTSRLADISVDMNANANEEFSANNYQAEVCKGILKLEGYYLLWRYSKKRFGLERANELLTSIWNGEVYFHDASGHGIQVPYCFAYSTTPIMTEGRPYGQLYSLPPRRSDSFVAQVIEATMDLSQDFVGAIAPGDFIVNLCYFLKGEGLDPDNDSDSHYILNQLQKFVHVMNNKFRVSGQSPFSNVSIFDRINLQKLFNEYRYPDGSEVDIEYVIKVEKIFARWFSKGDPTTGLPYRFPVVTFNLSVDKDRKPIDTDMLDFLSEVNCEKAPFNIYANEGSKIAMCCRFINDQERMSYRSDSFGNGGMNIGSHRVVTLNLPRLAMDCTDEIDFWHKLTYRLAIIRDLLLVHREEILRRRVKQGFLKFFNPLGWFNLDMLFSTIGIHGLYEMCYFLGTPLESEQGEHLVENVLKRIEECAVQFSEETKHSFNTEEIPAEGTAVVFANKDKVVYGDNNQPFSLYSNQYIPLIAEVPEIKRIDTTGKFMNIVSGGGILHLNIKEKINDPAKMKKLILLMLRKGVEHGAINYGFGICSNGHTSVIGNEKTCPICGDPIEDYLTRVIGYFTKVSSWGQVRREYEYPKRKFM
ncbi:MAG: anaerobic ribonucleoside-triphosphate reductase [Bacteroidota bacterium]|nr:anaerobic ribonucleoside-triphosphate reductase [Bacteroidota bacterium]